jgi:hypothetical protein
MDRVTPVWLLDIDGVVNAFQRQPRGAWPKRSWMRVRVRNFEIVAAAPVVAFLRQVHREGLAEVRWHTTWQDWAPEVGAALALPVFPVQDAPEFHDPAYIGVDAPWWKIPAVKRVVEQEQRPVVWTDDDLDLDRPLDIDTTRAPLLAVVPDVMTGLDRADLDRIRTFLNDYKDGAAQ